MTIDCRIRSGTHAVGDMGTSYKITAFPLQTDQDFTKKWLMPDYRQSTPPRRVRLTQTLDQALHDDGYYQWQWVFPMMTDDMLEYWLTTFLGSGALSAAVTVKAYDETKAGIHLTALILRPIPFEHMTPLPSGLWADVTFRFTKGVVIT